MARAAFIGVGVVFLCFLPPVLHFVTGPFSPLIGGIVAGMQLRPPRASTGVVAGMAVIMASVLTVTVAIVGSIVVAIVGGSAENGSSVTVSQLLIIAVIVGIYAFGFSFIGGLIGVSMRK